MQELADKKISKTHDQVGIIKKHSCIPDPSKGNQTLGPRRFAPRSTEPAKHAVNFVGMAIGEFAPWEMSGYLGIWLEMVGDVRISIDMFRDSGDPLGTSPTKEIQPRYPKIS